MCNCICVDCGVPVTYLRSVPEPRCHACRTVHHRVINRKYTAAYQRVWQKERYHRRNPDAAEHLPTRHWKNGAVPLTSTKPIRVVGIAPNVGDEDWRYYLEVYLDSTFDTQDFVLSAEDGCFNGLIVEHGARRYAVRDCRLEEVGR